MRLKKQQKKMRNAILAVLSALVLLTACNTQKRQIKRLQALSLAQPIEFARLSDLLNPCFDGTAKSDTIVKVDTIITPGKSDTVYTKGKGDTVIKTITVKQAGKTINKTTTIRDTVKDLRSLQVLNNSLKVKSDSLVVVKTQQASTKKNLGVWRLIALIACGVILVFVGIKVYTFFTGGAVKSLFK